MLDAVPVRDFVAITHRQTTLEKSPSLIRLIALDGCTGTARVIAYTSFLRLVSDGFERRFSTLGI